MAYGYVQRDILGAIEYDTTQQRYLTLGSLFKGGESTSTTHSFVAPAGIVLKYIMLPFSNQTSISPTFPVLTDSYVAATNTYTITATGGNFAVNILILGE